MFLLAYMKLRPVLFFSFFSVASPYYNTAKLYPIHKLSYIQLLLIDTFRKVIVQQVLGMQ